MSFTFAVSDVHKPTSAARKPTITAIDAATSRIGSPVEASAANLGNLVTTYMHPFVAATHLAFQEHVSLTISPDDVWLCIAQGFAQHIDVHAEYLRDRFVRHPGKAKIEVRRDEFVKGNADNNWPGVFGEFSDAIAKHIGRQRDLVVADFSTTGPVERAASEVVLMSAMRHYFEYDIMTMCGIPQITLLGTLEDWQTIKRRTEVLAEYNLDPWVRELSPILAQLCDTAAGRPKRSMWQSFYKYDSRSGGDKVTGWITTLFPYLRREESDQLDPVPAWNLDVSPSKFPSGLSTAPFTWSYLGTKLPMEFVAGFIGVSQDPTTLGVRPAIGWGIRDALVAQPVG